MIKEIAAFIVARVPTLTVGTTLQVGWREQGAPDACDLLTENGAATDFYVPERADVMIQITSRGAVKSYHGARDRAWAIYDVIHGTAGWELAALVSGGDAYIAQAIEAMSTPQYLGTDDKGRHEFSTNYIFRMLKTT